MLWTIIDSVWNCGGGSFMAERFYCSTARLCVIFGVVFKHVRVFSQHETLHIWLMFSSSAVKAVPKTETHATYRLC